MANFTPLGANLKWKGGGETSSSATIKQPIDNFVDTSGDIIIKGAVSGACRKCGFTGHLPYQCRNFIQLRPSQPVQIDVSSTSSEEYETPLTSKKGEKAHLIKKEKKKLLKILKKKLKRERKEEREKKRRKRKKSSSSDSSSTSDSGSSSDSSSSSDKHRRKKRKSKKIKRLKNKPEKKSKHKKKRYSSSSN